MAASRPTLLPPLTVGARNLAKIVRMLRTPFPALMRSFQPVAPVPRATGEARLGRHDPDRPVWS
jgi:hypothetical protein